MRYYKLLIEFIVKCKLVYIFQNCIMRPVRVNNSISKMYIQIINIGFEYLFFDPYFIYIMKEVWGFACHYIRKLHLSFFLIFLKVGFFLYGNMLLRYVFHMPV